MIAQQEAAGQAWKAPRELKARGELITRSLLHQNGWGKIRKRFAPVAQWIERCPPEADAGVRVAAGALNALVSDQGVCIW